MIALAQKLIARLQGRSGKWPAVRAAHLKLQPECAVCGNRGGNDVHHIVPYHVDEALELSPANLLTACRRDHLFVCHLGEWASWNSDCVADATAWRQKIANRPTAVPGQTEEET